MDEIVNIGFESYIIKDKITAVLPVDNSAVKRLKQLGIETGKVINLTFGKKSKSMLLTESGHILYSYLTPEKLIEKIFDNNQKIKIGGDE
ncbi:MAG: hypothetical protein PWQ77_102 [Kosmotogales bacterium]|nr:hypothetical protein [Kosmotogales bacterium]